MSILLAGATVGSFTGGSLADQFGRTRTFQLDAIPLAIGAYLWFVCHPLGFEHFASSNSLVTFLS